MRKQQVSSDEEEDESTNSQSESDEDWGDEDDSGDEDWDVNRDAEWFSDDSDAEELCREATQHEAMKRMHTRIQPSEVMQQVDEAWKGGVEAAAEKLIQLRPTWKNCMRRTDGDSCRSSTSNRGETWPCFEHFLCLSCPVLIATCHSSILICLLQCDGQQLSDGVHSCDVHSASRQT